MKNVQPGLAEQAEIFAMAEAPIHPGLTKGANDVESMMREAISAFNNENWSKATETFGSINPATQESIYYQALSLFKNEKYEEAIQLFNNDDLSDSVYAEEVKWYLGLAYILNGNLEAGTDVLKRINSGEWKYEEAQKLLK